tara:strand:+ start:3379 stop:6042 length:2664 start_codon:yes stop_codon:yes gene_type:complete
MRITKRNGSLQEVSFDKIQTRLNGLCNIDPNISLDISLVGQKVCGGIYDKIHSEELDILSAETSISYESINLDYGILASRILISNLHKKTESDFKKILDLLYYEGANEEYILNKKYYQFALENIEKINEKLDYNKDYLFNYFGFKTLEKSYLLKKNGNIIERPQHMFMRVSLSIHINDIEKALETFEMMSNHNFIHATPTLFNSGTKKQQFSSCFLLAIEDDSVCGIYDTLKDCAIISQHSGGIGLHIHNIRSDGSYIKGTNGKSNGIIPMLKVFNDTAKYIDQGGGKRNGSFAIYLEPWHADILEFIELKKNHGNEDKRARDLFYGLWIPDLFMEKVKTNEDWCLFCPNTCKGLSDVYGESFNDLYYKYEKENKYVTKIRARTLWNNICISQIETGTPYLLYKDHCNKKSNQNNLGTIKSSNLCTEIIEYTSPTETAVCNLASVSLKACMVNNKIDETFIIYSKPNCKYCDLSVKLCEKYKIKYVKESYMELDIYDERLPEKITFPQIFIDNEYIGGFVELEKKIAPIFDYNKLKKMVKILTQNLNNTIDYNFYPTDKTRRSNFLHRPIGIGVQGLADVFYLMKLPFESEESRILNEKIFECIYYASLEKSCEIAKEREIVIKNYKEKYKKYNELNIYSPVESSNDLKIMKRELDKIKEDFNIIDVELNRKEYLGTYSSYINSPMYNDKLQFDLWDVKVEDTLNDWTTLRKMIKTYGIRNSLLVAPMPTASTAQILNNFECFEPPISNIYSRRVLSGDYTVINNYMIEDLKFIDKWNEDIKNNIIANNGSVVALDIPNYLKERYKIVWEMKQKKIIDMAIDRGKFICQSQSMNLFSESADIQKLTQMHFYTWSKGLKTGIYYLRTRPSCKAIQFTISPGICESCSG